jgi:hypothetical protein
MPSLLSSPADQIKVVPVPVPAIGQDVSDRGIAHVATGGIGRP